jgi:hypothetical protein
LWSLHKPADYLLKDEMPRDKKMKKKITNKLKMRVYQAVMDNTSAEDTEEEQDDTHSDGESEAGDSESS